MKRILIVTALALVTRVGLAQTAHADHPPVPTGVSAEMSHPGLAAAMAANPTPADYKAMVKTTTATLKTNPKEPAALSQRALAHLRLKDYDKALEDYNLLVSLKAAKPEDYMGRAEAKMGLVEYPGAIADLNLVLRQRPGDPAATLARGIARLYNNDLRNAIADFTRVISPPDPNAPAPAPAAPAKRNGVKMPPRPTAKPTKAAETAAADATPPPPPPATPEQLAQAYKYRGAAYVATKKPKEGCEDLNKALEMAPKDADIQEEIRRNCK